MEREVFSHRQYDEERALYHLQHGDLEDCVFAGPADGESALMLVCARLRHVASSEWGSKRYLNMEHLKSMILSEEEGYIAG